MSTGGGFQGVPMYTAPATSLHCTWAPYLNQVPLNPPLFNQSGRIQKIEPVTTSFLVNNKSKIEKFQISTPVAGIKVSNPASNRQYVPPSPEPSGIHQSHLQPSEDRADRVIEAVCGQMAKNRLPVLEPEVFDGKDPLAFPLWRLAFDALVDNRTITDTDKLNLLNKYLKGEAKRAIQGYLLLSPSEAYYKAYRVLLNRYGDHFKLAGAFKEQLRSWPRVGATDAAGLRDLVDFLQQCSTAQGIIPALKLLDDESVNGDLLRKLPAWIARKWAKKVSAYRDATAEFPPFAVFVEFLFEEEKVVNDPISRAYQRAESTKERNRGGSFLSENREVSPEGASFGVCTFCKGKHALEMCRKFGSEQFEVRMRFVKENRMCFKCLLRGHISRECRRRMTCQFCQGSHATSMHREEWTTEGPPSTTNR